MPTFRPYTSQEIEEAARAYGLDPDFVDAIYAAESSRGTNPKAMEPRSVKRKRDSTIVRGPFQLEDGTTSDLIRKHKLGNVDIDDPDVHLDLALRLMRDLKDRYNGDLSKMARAYLGFGTDELGTTDSAYKNKVLAEIERIKAKKAKDEPTDIIDVVPTSTRPMTTPSSPLNDIAPFMVQGGEPDIFGYSEPIPPLAGADQGMGLGAGTKWSGLFAGGTGLGAGQNAFALPPSVATGPGARITDEADVHAYIQSLVEDELGSRQFSNA